MVFHRGPSEIREINMRGKDCIRVSHMQGKYVVQLTSSTAEIFIMMLFLFVNFVLNPTSLIFFNDQLWNSYNSDQ